jgi:hypothetical protein
MSIDDIIPTMRWAEKCIEEFKAEDFDPFAVLMDTETKEQKMFIECVAYLEGIEKLTEDFRKSRKSIANIMNI